MGEMTEYGKTDPGRRKQMESGADPKGVIRDPAANGTIPVPVKGAKAQRVDGFESLFRRQIRYATVATEILRLYVPDATGELTAI